MRVTVTYARRHLAELVRRALGGEEVILTRRGRPVASLLPKQAPRRPADRRAILEAVRASGSAKALPGPSAAVSQDFLYGDASPSRK